MADRIESIQILFQKRNARRRGPLDSEQYNDNIEELSHDLATIASQWNNRLTPLTETLPNLEGNDNLDAFADGLDGKSLYVNSAATAVSDARYFNTTQNRPSTVYEEFGDIYDAIDDLETNLEGQISTFSFTASQIPIVDGGGLYTAANVETALAEVRTAVNNVTAGALDLSAVAQHYVPSTDNTYDLGTTAKRIRDLYVGPSSVNLVSKAGDTANSVAKTYQVGVNLDAGSHTGKLEFKDGATVLLRLSTAGVEAAAGLSLALGDLTNVSTAGAVNQHVLTYNGSSWSAATVPRNLNSLSDVVLTSPTAGHFLRYNGANWVESTANLNNLSDVSIIALTAGDILRYNGSNFVNTKLDLNELTDVTVSSLVSGHFLRYNGLEWTEDIASLEDLDNLSIGAVQSGQTIVYDGSEWLPAEHIESDGSSLSSQVAFWTSPTTLDGSNDLWWDLNNSRLGIKDVSPDEALVVSGILGLGESANPTARSGFGKLWYGTDDKPHFMNTSGDNHLLAEIDISTSLDDGKIAFFGDELISTSSGLDWNSTTQTLAIGNPSPNGTAGLDVGVGAGPILLPRLTTAQRDALAAVNGMIIYNINTDEFQGYAGGSWVNLH